MTTLSATILRICLTAILAFPVARLVNGLLFFVLWPGLYWGWGYLGRRRAAQGMRTLLWNAKQDSPRASIAKNHSEIRRVARIVGWTFAAITFAGVVLVLISIESDRQTAKEARAKIHEGMNIGEVLHTTSAAAFLWANADYSETATGRARAVNLAPGSESGTFSYFDDALSKDREITAPEALAILHQRLGDGIPWRVEYFFTGQSLEHFSFKVVFDKDGHVREVTPLYGSFE